MAGSTVNQRALRTRRRELLRALGVELRRMREDAGRSQAAIARASGVSQAHLSTIEAGDAEPSLEVLIAVATALGADLSIRCFPGSGPRVRDHLQLAMSEALLAALHPRWRVTPEVPVYRPIRGVIDLVLEDRRGPAVIATELQSQLRRIEQQVLGSPEGRRARSPAGARRVPGRAAARPAEHRRESRGGPGCRRDDGRGLPRSCGGRRRQPARRGRLAGRHPRVG